VLVGGRGWGRMRAARKEMEGLGSQENR
jgi:hypothetical protein